MLEKKEEGLVRKTRVRRGGRGGEGRGETRKKKKTFGGNFFLERKFSRLRSAR